MNSKINSILEEIDKRKQELKVEYKKLIDKYGFTIKGKKIIFNSIVKKKNKKEKKTILHTLSRFRLKEIIGIPFTFLMIFPAFILDIMLFIYQNIVFRTYGIPLVKRSDYIVYDKNQLDYLNFIQKINCLYCSYVNGLFAYSVEVGGRTEKYWCPIKHAEKLAGGHKWEKEFADFGDVEGFKEALNDRKKY